MTATCFRTKRAQVYGRLIYVSSRACCDRATDKAQLNRDEDVERMDNTYGKMCSGREFRNQSGLLSNSSLSGALLASPNTLARV
jgi:hypothetical protein